MEGLGETRNFIYREPSAANALDYLDNNFQNGADINQVTADQGFRWLLDENGQQAYMTTGQQIQFNFSAGANIGTKTYTYDTDFTTIQGLLNAITQDLNQGNSEGYALSFNETTGVIEDNAGALASVSVLDSTGAAPLAGSPLDNLNTAFSSLTGAGTATSVLKKNDTYYFTDIQELVNLYQLAVDDLADPNTTGLPYEGSVYIGEFGEIVVENTGSNPIGVYTSGYPDDILANLKFLETMSSLSGPIASNATNSTSRLYAATHATSIEVFSSSGSKHNITLHFRKESTSTDASTPSVWNWYAEAPEPSTFNYPASGTLKFNEDGSLQSFNPPTLVFNPNTGASSNQIMQLNFGSINGFDGMTSFSSESTTNARNRDGYSGGFLKEITVDQTGTVIGTFSNDQNFKLGQVALATFANNAGLDSRGGNVFAKSPNSGEENIGTAGTGSRGGITPSTLEMSNVDLSDSLTNLIVVQRGFQANSKTITTSDQMLQTLLGLKQ
jgi:flagellar hook protein FlgE